MKPSKIQVGKCYRDGKGKIRKVYDLAQYGRDKFEEPYVLYTRESGPVRVGENGGCYLSTFAAWAKEELPCLT